MCDSDDRVPKPVRKFTMSSETLLLVTALLVFLSRVGIPIHAQRDIVMANPSVCRSVSHVETIAHIVTLIPPSDRGVTRLFPALSPLQNYKENSLSGALNTLGGKKLRFSIEIAVYLGNGTRHALIGTLIGIHRQQRRSVAVPLTLYDLERRDAMGQKFLADFDNYAAQTNCLT